VVKVSERLVLRGTYVSESISSSFSPFLLFGDLNLLGVLLNLIDEIDEVSVSIRSVVRSSLFSFT
jgi:hypothetical protein